MHALLAGELGDEPALAEPRLNSFRAQHAWLLDPSASGGPAGRLLGFLACLELRHRSDDRAAGRQSQLLAIVVEGEGLAASHRVRDTGAVDRDLEQAVEKGQAEGQALDSRWQTRSEPERISVVAHSAETVHDRQPRSCERPHVYTVTHVVLQVVQVHQRSLAKVVVCELEMADLGRDDRLRA